MAKTNSATKENNHIVIIGGGPAGMMAAIYAARAGKKVTLLEKNKRLGEKLRITGGGRCNVTNNKPVVRDILSQYKEGGKFLFSTFVQHGVRDTIDFFADKGLPFIEENEGRMFPYTQSAQSVFDVLYKEMKHLGVDVRSQFKVESVVKKGDGFVIKATAGQEIVASRVVISTGGVARPETGSTGDALPWLKKFGHTIHSVDNSLVPIEVNDDWIFAMAGKSVADAKIAIYSKGKKQGAYRGKMLFTHTGLSGPLILNQSKKIGDLLKQGEVTIKIDAIPDIEEGDLQKILQENFTLHPNKKVKNILNELMGVVYLLAVLKQSGVSGDEPARSITATDRRRLVRTIKSLMVNVTGLLGADKAIVSSGGVDLAEIDFRTMESKVVSGLYIVGDVLNINRPSGGYSLQLYWSTGAVAGMHV